MQEQITHIVSLCKLQESFLFNIYTKRIITHGHIARFHSQQHKLHKGQSNWYISSMLVHMNDQSGTLIIIKLMNLL